MSSSATASRWRIPRSRRGPSRGRGAASRGKNLDDGAVAHQMGIAAVVSESECSCHYLGGDDGHFRATSLVANRSRLFAPNSATGEQFPRSSAGPAETELTISGMDSVPGKFEEATVMHSYELDNLSHPQLAGIHRLAGVVELDSPAPRRSIPRETMLRTLLCTGFVGAAALACLAGPAVAAAPITTNASVSQPSNSCGAACERGDGIERGDPSYWERLRQQQFRELEEKGCRFDTHRQVYVCPDGSLHG